MDFCEDTLYEETSFTIEAKLVFGLLYLLDDMLKEMLCKLYWLLWFASFTASRARFFCARGKSAYSTSSFRSKASFFSVLRKDHLDCVCSSTYF